MTRMMTLLLVVALASVVFMTGCEKFTKIRYDSIQNGQSKDSVQATLGETPYKFSDTWSYVHDDPFYKAVIKFDADGRVIDKAWYDSKEMGTHPDSKQPPVSGKTEMLVH